MAIVGGVCLLVLLSIMNFANNSYVLVIQDTSDPNATVSETWFKHWPSYLTRSAQPICQPQDFPINTRFFTNQTALQYTIMSISNSNHSKVLASPSLSYFNNVLEDCKVTKIQMDFDGTLDQPYVQYQNVSWGATVTAFATCEVGSPDGKTSIEMTTMYDPVPSFPSPGSSNFISTDALSKASLYWAEFLLSGLWTDTTARVANISAESDNPLLKGFVVLYPSQKLPRISSTDFFELKFAFQSKNGTHFWGGTNGPWDAVAPVEYFIQNKAYPRMWNEVDLLGKAMYSAVVADLGLVSSSSQHNLVTNTTAVKDLLSRISSKGYTGWYGEAIEVATFNELFENTRSGPLTLTPSVISTKYRCQVPRLKSGGEIFISILLADLVLLSAAWYLFTLAVRYLALRNLPDADHCEGCSRADESKGMNTIKEVKQPSKYARVATTSVSERRRTSSNPESDTEI